MPKARIIASHGYVLVFVGKGHHLADVRGYAYEHRVVAEQKLGRRLTDDEVVHHINGTKDDNRPENLEVEPSRWHHNAEHRTLPTKRQEPGQPNERIACACGCGETRWRFDAEHIERRFISGHNGLLAKKVRPVKPPPGEHNRSKTHCSKGHEYTPENTRKAGSTRICKTCHREREAQRRKEAR